MIKKINTKTIKLIKFYNLINYNLIYNDKAINRYKKDTFEILKSEKQNSNLKILLHCFTGSYDFAKKLIDLNCYISVSGIITFKNSIELTRTISLIHEES